MITNTQRNQAGVAHMTVVIGLVVIIIAALGFIFWQNFVYKTPEVKSTPVAAQDKQEKPAAEESVKEYTPTVPSGWVVREDSELGFSYAVPAGEKISYNLYKVGKMIHIGYGAPVYVSYSAVDGWQTYENDKDNKPTVKRSDNLVEALEAKAENRYQASYYVTGDGPTAETRALVVVDDTVYQFTFAKETKTEKFLSEFVQTIKFD